METILYKKFHLHISSNLSSLSEINSNILTLSFLTKSTACAWLVSITRYHLVQASRGARTDTIHVHKYTTLQQKRYLSPVKNEVDKKKVSFPLSATWTRGKSLLCLLKRREHLGTYVPRSFCISNHLQLWQKIYTPLYLFVCLFLWTPSFEGIRYPYWDLVYVRGWRRW